MSFKKCFPGISSIELEEKQIKGRDYIEIIGFKSLLLENIFLPQPIRLELYSNKELFFMDVVAKMEEQSLQLLKSSIFKNLLAFSKFSLDYVSLFKTITGKQTFFQSLYVLNDIFFFMS